VLDWKPRRLRPNASLEKIVLEICRYFHLEEKDFFVKSKDHNLSEARGMAASLVLELAVGMLAELSSRMGRDVATLSAGVKRLQIRSKRDSELADAMKLLLKAIS
jgi:chromosomal replication initiation ATPase DnaA